MIGLLDLNVLIALAWPNHTHHSAAHHWFRQNQKLGWATCPVTQSGFIRVSSNPKLLPEARSPSDALALLKKIIALPHHVFWTDDTYLAETRLVAASKLRGYRQVTDAHLLALALRREGRLVTLDRGIRNLVPDGFSSESVELID